MQDIRIIRLAKWQIPKTNSVMNYIGDDTYLSIGHFDMINVKEVKERNLDDEIHPFLAAYNMSHRHTKNGHNSQNQNISLDDYSIQELIIFANIGKNGFSKEQIDNFWKDDSLILFMSLIHIDNANSIFDVTKKLNDCFLGKNYL